MANEEVLGPRKTMFVLVIVVGCFAVLWPRILSPVILGTTRDQLQPNQFDREAGCCEVLFEPEVAVLELVNEVCGLAVGANGKLSPYAAAECRKAVNETCGVDIAAFLKRNENVGITTKKLLDIMKNSNSSCLKEHFGVPVWSLSTHPAFNSWTLQDTVKQERPPIRGIAPHPALRERGRAIPAGAPTPPSRGPVPLPPHARVRSSPLSVYFELDIKPPPIPGMRPPLGSPGGPVPAPKSSMGFVMPIYTICIIVFFVYTLSKILFKRGSTVPYDDVLPDPQFRRRVFRDDSRASRSSPDTKLVVTAISGLVAEVQQQMEASYGHNQQRQDVQDNHTRPYTNGTVLSDSTPIRIMASEFKDQSKETTPLPQQDKEVSPERKEYIQEQTQDIPESIDSTTDVATRIGYLEEMPKHGELMSHVREITPEEEAVLIESDQDLISVDKYKTNYDNGDLESRDLTTEQITVTDLNEPAQKDTEAIVRGGYESEQAKQIIESEEMTQEPTEITNVPKKIDVGQEIFPSNEDAIQVQTDSNCTNKQPVESSEDPPVIYETNLEELVNIDLDLKEASTNDIERITKSKQLGSEVKEIALDLEEDSLEEVIQEPETKIEISDSASQDLTPELLIIEPQQAIQEDIKVKVTDAIPREFSPEPLKLESEVVIEKTETKAEVSDSPDRELTTKLLNSEVIDAAATFEISESALKESTPQPLIFHEQEFTEKSLQSPVDSLPSELREQKVNSEENSNEAQAEEKQELSTNESVDKIKSDLSGEIKDKSLYPEKSDLIAEEKTNESIAQAEEKQELSTNDSLDKIKPDLSVEMKDKSLHPEQSDLIAEGKMQNNFEEELNSLIIDSDVDKLVEITEGDKVKEVVKFTEDFLNEARIVSTEELEKQKLSTLELLKEALEEEKESNISNSEVLNNESEQENASVKVVGMELTAHSADGGIWPRAEPPPVTPVPPQRPPHEAEEVKSIFLKTEIPQKSRVLVADFEDRPESPQQPRKDSPLVVSGKMTLSLIQDAPRDTPEREPESTVDEFTTASAATDAAAEKDEEFSEEEIEEEIEIEEVEEEEDEEEEMPDIQEAIHQIKKTETPKE